MEMVVLSGGSAELAGTKVELSKFVQMGPYLFYVSADGHQYRLTDQIDGDGVKQAVFCGKVF